MGTVMRATLAAGLGLASLLWAGVAGAGDLEVTVVVTGGGKLARGTLAAGDQELAVTGAGKVLFKGLPDKRIAVTVDAVTAEKGGARYLGVADVKTLPGKTVAVTVTAAPVADLEAFCVGCHPSKGDPVRPGQVVRDVHVTGLELAGPYLKQVERYNAEAERQAREKVPDAQLPFVVDRRVVKEGGKEVVKTFYTCETCHTIHRPTPWPKSVRGPYKRSPVFCEGCH